MICPQCGHEGNTSQRACWYCGFIPAESSPGGPTTGEPQNKREGPEQRIASQQLHSNNIVGRPVPRPSSYLQSPEQSKKQQPSPLRATRITTTPLSNDKAAEQTTRQAISASGIAPTVSAALVPADGKEDIVFAAGTLLKGGRYRLVKKQEEQRWTNGIYESHWTAQDLSQKNANVIISELGLTDMKAATRQSHLRTGMRALFSAAANPHIATLTNVFRESGRDFFVFEASEGETLVSLMKRSGQTLPEQDVIECCLQVLEALEFMAAQTPPLVHGLINPDHLVLAGTGSWYVTDFSVVLASGAASFITGIDPTKLSPFTAPEFAKGIINSSSDLYSLLATAHFAITGTTQRGQSAATSRISSALGAILQKGLHPIASQRYQQPTALRQDLKALRPNSSASLSLRIQDSGRNTLPPLPPETDRNGLPPLNPPEFNRSTLPPLNPPEFNWGSPPPLTSQEHAQRMPMAAPTTGWEERKSEPRLMPNQPSALASAKQGSLNPLSQAFSSLPFADEIEIPTRNLLPRPEDLPPMPRGNDMLTAFLWMGGIMFCLLILVLIK
jgi:serine/threonine protein kinase